MFHFIVNYQENISDIIPEAEPATEELEAGYKKRIFAYAQKMGIIASNPADGTRKAEN